MGSSDDLKYICTMLKEARTKSMDACEYENSLSIYETVHKLLFKATNSCADLSMREKVIRLRDVCRVEMKILKEYISEKSKFLTPPHTGGNRHGNVRMESKSTEDDPDIWPPPTPPTGGGNNRNNNQLARPATNNNNRAFGGRNGNNSDVSHANDARSKVEQMKKERDTNISNRKV